MPVDDITKRAMAAVGDDKPNSDWVLKPEEHADQLPPAAGALKRVLEREGHQTTIKAYRAHDAEAVWAQVRYKRAGRVVLSAALVATLIGAVFLLPATQNIPLGLRQSATVAEYFMLFVAFFAARYLSLARPFEAWMKARALAEIARIQLFNEVVQESGDVRAGELPLLPLKLEYFRRYQLDVQRRYYEGRGNQHARAAGHTKVWQFTSLSLGVIAGLVVLLASLPILGYFHAGLSSSLRRLTEFAVALRTDDNRWLLGIGVAASALYGFSMARSLMNLDERNASRYLTTCDNLDLLGEEQLAAARKHAVEGKETEVRAFVDRVQALISSEHQEWVRWRELAPQPNVRAVYMVLPKQG
jgi:hypothetical protein